MRALVWLLLGGVATAGVAIWRGWIDPKALRDAWGRVPSRDADELHEDAPTEPAEPEPPTVGTSRTAAGPVRCCIGRDELGTSPLARLETALARRWPGVSTREPARLVLGDRVAFLVEVGATPSTVARELVTGRVVALRDDVLGVRVDRDAALACRHGLCRDAELDVPRRSVLAWAGRSTPEHDVPIAWPHDVDESSGVFVRNVRVGQPFEVAVPIVRDGMRWRVDPPHAATLHGLSASGRVARLVFTRGPASGRVHVELSADDPGGPLLLGRWAFQF